MPNSQLEIAGAELVRRLGGHWAGDRGMCLCPAHHDHTPSLSVRVGDQSLLFKCFAGCETLDVLRALRRLRLDVPHDPSRPIMVPDPRAPNPMRKAARELWDAARTITGGLADRYLQSRHLATRPAALRFHPRTPLGRGQAARYRPAIIAAIVERNRLVSVQRFFLERDGSALARDLEKPKRTLARPLGGAVQLCAPGPVLGLAEGGSCRAQAIGVGREREAEVLAILDARELVTGVYHRKRLPLELAGGGTIEAWCYLARSDHEQFAGDLEAVDALRLIRQGHGRGGDNSEYVLNTAEHLRILGIRDDRLELLTMHLAADRNARIR